MTVRSREQPRKHTYSQTYHTHTHTHTHTIQVGIRTPGLDVMFLPYRRLEMHVLLFQLVVGGLVDGRVGWWVNWWVDGFVGQWAVWWTCVVCA